MIRLKRAFNKPIRILLIADGLILVSGAMIGPIYALFVQKIGGDLLEASYVFGVYSLAAGLTTLISGKYTDKVRESRRIVVLGYGIMALAFFGYIFVTSIWSLLVVQLILGMGEAIYAPAFDALFSRHLDGRKAGRAWGTWESINYFTTAIGAIAGGILVTYFSFNAMFIVMGSISLFSALYILRLPKRVL